MSKPAVETQKSWENVEFFPNKDNEMNTGKCKYNLKQMTKDNTFLEYKLY